MPNLPPQSSVSLLMACLTLPTLSPCVSLVLLCSCAAVVCFVGVLLEQGAECFTGSGRSVNHTSYTLGTERNINKFEVFFYCKVM